VARALRPKRVPSMATTSAGGTSQLASTRLRRPAARSAATFHSDRIATPCPATAHYTERASTLKKRGSSELIIQAILNCRCRFDKL